MLERKFVSQFRGELYKVLNNVHEHLLMDAPKSGKKPYDFFFLWHGWHVSVEAKSTKKGASISRNCVTAVQMQSLKDTERAGGRGFIVVLMARIKQVLIITPDAWEIMFADESLKTVKLDDIHNVIQELEVTFPEDVPMIISREKWFEVGGKKTTMWNFQPWIKNIYDCCAPNIKEIPF